GSVAVLVADGQVARVPSAQGSERRHLAAAGRRRRRADTNQLPRARRRGRLAALVARRPRADLHRRRSRGSSRRRLSRRHRSRARRARRAAGGDRDRRQRSRCAARRMATRQQAHCRADEGGSGASGARHRATWRRRAAGGPSLRVRARHLGSGRVARRASARVHRTGGRRILPGVRGSCRGRRAAAGHDRSVEQDAAGVVAGRIADRLHGLELRRAVLEVAMRLAVGLLALLPLAAGRHEGTADAATGATRAYFDRSERDDVLSGGVKMIPISTPHGTFKVWTKRVGNNPRAKVLLLHGGPAATHEYFEAFDSYFPAAGIEYYYYDQL